jgi:competence transcription factor ComK
MNKIMEKEEIEFIKERIVELEKYQENGTTKIGFSNGKPFSIDLALTTFKNILI